MSFHTALERDLAKIMEDKSGFAVDIVFTDSTNNAKYTLRGLFSNAPGDFSAGEMKNPFLGNTPLISIHAVELQKHIQRKVLESDEIEIQGITYTCQSPRYDTYGMLSIKLQEKKETFTGVNLYE